MGTFRRVLNWFDGYGVPSASPTDQFNASTNRIVATIAITIYIVFIIKELCEWYPAGLRPDV